jgi:hypothetical protein
MKLFSRPAPPELPKLPEPPKAIRTAAFVREELAVATESQAPLEARLRDAESELASAQRRYDAGVQAFALGQGREPDRGEVQALVTKIDALRRVTKSHAAKIGGLRTELADVELAEVVAEGREKLPALTAAAQAKLDGLDRALKAALEAERDLFALLFDEKAGLKQHFAGELAKQAARVRHQLRQRVIALAEKHGHEINVRFETDGEANMGASLDHFIARRRAVGNWL